MTTVFIWNNSILAYRFAKLVGYAPADHKVTGHTALNIDDNFANLFDGIEANDFVDNKESYVSWIPATMKRHHAEQNSHDGKRMGVGNRNFFADMFMERYAPDHLIRIPNVNAVRIGRMRQEWQRHVQTKDGRGNTYDFKRKNCSRIVSRVLRSGWGLGRGNIRYGQTISGLWTPLMVKRLALDLKPDRPADAPYLLSWADFIDELLKKGKIQNATAGVLKQYRKRASNRGSSGAESRFRIQGSWKSVFGKGWQMEKEEENIKPEVLIYTELRERGSDREEAMQSLMKWLDISYNLELNGRTGPQIEQEARILLHKLRHLKEKETKVIASRRGFAGKWG